MKNSLFRTAFCSVLFLLCAMGKVHAQPPNESPSSILFVTASEYRVKVAPPPDATPESVLKQLNDGSFKPTRTVRLSTCNSAESQFLVTEAMPSHSSKPAGAAKTRGLADSPKLMVSLRAERQANGVIMEFNYSVASPGDASADQANIQSKVVQTVSFFELGKPKLIAGLTGDEEFYLVVTVTEPNAEASSKEH